VRAALAAVAALLGVLAALAAAALWTAGRDALDDDRFADRVVAALRAPEGQEAIASRVTAALIERGATASVAPTVAETVERTVATDAFAAAMGPDIARAHDDVLDLSGETIEVDLEGLRALVAGELVSIDPALVSLVPPPGALGAVDVGKTPEVPALPLEDLNDRVPVAVGVLSLAAAALLAGAIALARGPARVARAAAIALVVLAAVPALAGILLPGVVEDAVDPPDEGVARVLAEDLLGAWPWAAAGLAIAGAGLLAVATAASRSGTRSRPRTRTRAA
jgi:hypothetical protein